MKVMIVNINRCNGCYNCQIACKDEHVGNDWSPYAKPQPDIGQFWLKVNETVRGSIPKIKVTYEPFMCQHCDAAPCMASCQVEGAIYKDVNGAVIIDPTKCSGCKNCVYDCPYGVIYFNEDLQLAQKCTLCSHLLNKGWQEPRCVDVCPTGALQFGEEADLQDLIRKAEVLHPEFKTKPRIYYLGIPKKFIAGAIYDPGEDECVGNAIITLTKLGSDNQYITRSDNFGDFWFKDLEDGNYSMVIKAEGFLPKTIDSISVGKDINLGDIALVSWDS